MTFSRIQETVVNHQTVTTTFFYEDLAFENCFAPYFDTTIELGTIDCHKNKPFIAGHSTVLK